MSSSISTFTFNYDKNYREDLKKYAVRATNDLKRILIDEQNKRVYTKNGLSLNGRGLVNTGMAIANGRENLDRYKVFQQRQVTLAGFSFAFDFSGSMGGFSGFSSFERQEKDMHTYESLIYAMESLLNILTPLGIKSYIGGVTFKRKRGINAYDKQFETATDDNEISLKVIKTDKEKFNINKAFSGTQPAGATSLTAYALGAMEMINRIQGIDKKIAIYMTDGADPCSMPYLKSLEEQAKSQGITLICAVYSRGLDESVIRHYQRLDINLVIFNSPKDFISLLVDVLKKEF